MKAVSHAITAAVVRNQQISAHYFVLEVEAPEPARLARPGQFAMLRPAPSLTDPLLGRPLAVFDTDLEKETLSFLYIPVGRGTRLLSALRPGQQVFMNGPLGKGFDLSGDEPAVGVAGGTGVAAVRFLLKKAKEAGRGARLFLGARTGELLVPGEHLVFGGELVCTTDDGSFGMKGTIVDGLRQALAEGGLSGTEKYFTAGPTAMMKAAAALAKERGLWMEVSLEARMGCGVGACRGCIVPAVSPHRLYGFRHRAVCTDGPVFAHDEIDWPGM